MSRMEFVYRTASRSYFFVSGFQFWISVIGAMALSSYALIRKRPSRATS